MLQQLRSLLSLFLLGFTAIGSCGCESATPTIAEAEDLTDIQNQAKSGDPISQYRLGKKHEKVTGLREILRKQYAYIDLLQIRDMQKLNAILALCTTTVLECQ